MRVDSARQADSVSPDGRSAVDMGCTGEPWALAGRHVFYRRPPPRRPALILPWCALRVQAALRIKTRMCII